MLELVRIQFWIQICFNTVRIIRILSSPFCQKNVLTWRVALPLILLSAPNSKHCPYRGQNQLRHC